MLCQNMQRDIKMENFKQYLNENSTPRAYSLSNIRVTKDGTIFLRPIGIIEDVIKMAVDMEEQGDDEFLIAIINVISPLKLIKEINKFILKDKKFFKELDTLLDNSGGMTTEYATENLHDVVYGYTTNYLEKLKSQKKYRHLELADNMGILDK